MKPLKIVNAVVMWFITLPIWLYLLYQILIRVEATELMWFLYWVYVPFAIFVGIVGKIVEQPAQAERSKP